MKRVFALLITLLTVSSGFANELCNQELQGVVVEVTKQDSPQYMRFNGETITKFDVLVSLKQNEQGRAIAKEKLVKLTAQTKELKLDQTYKFLVNDSTLCSFSQI